jgi:hypothetical protein
MFGRLGANADDYLDWDHLYGHAYMIVRDGRRRTRFSTLHWHLDEAYEAAVEYAVSLAFKNGALAAQFSAFELATFRRDADALDISPQHYFGPWVVPSRYVDHCNRHWDVREPGRDELREFLSAEIRHHARWLADRYARRE